MLDFKKVELGDKKVLDSFFLTNELIDYSAYNFLNIFIYRNILNYEWCIFEDLLLVYSKRENVFYLPIYKERKLLEYDKFLKITEVLKAQYPNSSYLLVPEVFINANKEKLEKNFKVKEDEKYFDYVYSTSDLANLNGKDYHNKRNLISQFDRLFSNYTYEKLSESDYDECFKLAKIWCEYKTCEDFGFTHETSALKECFLNFNNLNFGGEKLIVDGKIGAFSVYSQHRADTFLVSFEKYHPLIKGASQVINKITALELSNKCVFLNREQDLGIEGLRKAKKSYMPEHMGKVFSIV